MTGKSPASEADRRVEHLVHNTGALRKSLKDRNEDAARSQRLLKMLPDAFIFKFGSSAEISYSLIFHPIRSLSRPAMKHRSFTP